MVDSTSSEPSRRRDHSPWNWLLLLPIALPLIPALFNSIEPKLFGFPLFYWLQLAYVVIGVCVTTLVYRVTRTRFRNREQGRS